MDDIAVLVLNYSFEPLHFTNARRAVTLLLSGKAESVEESPRVVRSPTVTLRLPAVIRLAFKRVVEHQDGYVVHIARYNSRVPPALSTRPGLPGLPARQERSLHPHDRVRGDAGHPVGEGPGEIVRG